MYNAANRRIPEKEYLTIEQRKVVNWYRMVLQDNNTSLWLMDLSDFLNELRKNGSVDQKSYCESSPNYPQAISQLGKLVSIVDANVMALRLFGYSNKNIFLSQPVSSHIVDYEEVMKLFTKSVLKSHQYIEIETKALHNNGTTFKISIKLITPLMTDNSSNVVVSIARMSDVEQLAIKLFDNKYIYESFVKNAPVCIHEIDQEGRLESMNSAGLNMMQLDHINDIKGCYYLDLVDKNDRNHIKTLLQRAHEGYSSEFEFSLAVNNNTRIFTSCFIPMEKISEGKRRIVGVTQDITERKVSEEELYRMANYDSLTELRNRTSFIDSLNQLIAQAFRLQHSFALLFVDLDNFKPINDNFGHKVGDSLLKEVSIRIRSVLQEEDLACRYGGDEFLILLPSIDEKTAAEEVAYKIQESFKKLIKQSGRELDLYASIGISIFPQDGKDAEKLLAHADEAMYQAKRSGGNQIRFYLSD